MSEAREHGSTASATAAYDGPRGAPFGRSLSLALFTARRVLGLGAARATRRCPRHARHRLPAGARLGAVAMLDENLLVGDLITYGDYTSSSASALALFAAFVAPEALCPDRRTGMLGLYLAGPLDRDRYLLAKGAAVFGVMLLITRRAAALHDARVRRRGLRADAGESPRLSARIVAVGMFTALFYTVGLAAPSRASRRGGALAGVIVPARARAADRRRRRSTAAARPTPSRPAQLPRRRRRARRTGSSGRPGPTGRRSGTSRRRSSRAASPPGRGRRRRDRWLRYRRIEAFR